MSGGRPQELLLRVNSSYNTFIFLKPFPLSFGGLLEAFTKLASIFLTHILTSQKIGFFSGIPNTLLLWHLCSTIGQKNKSSALGLCPRFSVCELGQVTLPLCACFLTYKTDRNGTKCHGVVPRNK